MSALTPNVSAKVSADCPRVDREHRDPRALQPAGQLSGEPDVGQLGHRVHLEHRGLTSDNDGDDGH